MITKIRTESEFKKVMNLIENYLQKATKGGGFHTLSKEENRELKKLSQLAEQYEDKVLKIMTIPLTLESIVLQKIKTKQLSQRKLAEQFEMSTSKISQILNGQRSPDVSFLKAVHEKLGIDGNLILEIV